VQAPILKGAVPGLGQVALTWTQVAAASSYAVYSGGTEAAAKNNETLRAKGITDIKAIITGLTNGQNQFFIVRALVAGGESEPSNVLPAEPSVNATLKDLKATPQEGGIALSWTTIGATSYKVYSAEGSEAPKPVPGLEAISGSTFTFTQPIPNLQVGHIYSFRVDAVSSSATTTSQTQGTPLPPKTATTAPAKAPPAEKEIDIAVTHCNQLPGWTAAELAESEGTNPDSNQSTPSAATKNSHTIRVIQQALDMAKRQHVLHKKSPGNQADLTLDEAKATVQCNGWLANYTRDQQTQSSVDSVQTFPKFNASFANNSQLATTQFVKAFLPTWLERGTDFTTTVPSGGASVDGYLKKLDPYVNSHAWNDIGLSISSSVPISGATLKDYGAQEVLTHDGGLVNLYASLSGRTYSNEAYNWGDRKANLDRLYFIDIWGGRQPATAKQALAYITEGIGVKALKTTLTGNVDLGVQGTAYVGIGIDGPLFYATQDAQTVNSKLTTGPAGMVSLDTAISYNFINRTALDAMFGPNSAGQKYLASATTLQLYITNSIGIQLQYSVPFESSVNHSIGHVAMLKIGYNQPTSASASKTAATTSTDSSSTTPPATSSTDGTK
jgi:hypothetical protein